MPDLGIHVKAPTDPAHAEGGPGCPPSLPDGHSVNRVKARAECSAFGTQVLARRSSCRTPAAIGRRAMPPVSEPRRPASVSKPWRERPRRRACRVAPRLPGGVVHATARLSVFDVGGMMIEGGYAPVIAQVNDVDLCRDLQMNLRDLLQCYWTARRGGFEPLPASRRSRDSTRFGSSGRTSHHAVDREPVLDAVQGAALPLRPRVPRGLRALTAPPRGSQSGSCVMAQLCASCVERWDHGESCLTTASISVILRSLRRCRWHPLHVARCEASDRRRSRPR